MMDVRGGKADDGSSHASDPSIGRNASRAFSSAPRTQLPGDWIPSQLITYDPAMSRVCGCAAAAVIFSWLESEFLSGVFKPKPELRYTYTEMCARVGMRKYQFTPAFQRIAVTHLYSHEYRRALLTGREFWQPKHQRHVFYSMEVMDRKGNSIVRRNARAIEQALCDSPHTPVELPNGPKKTARQDAQRLFGL